MFARGPCRSDPDAVPGQAVGTGHYVQLEVPEQLNAMIEQFLRRYVA